jgi:hypothetical protein
MTLSITTLGMTPLCRYAECCCAECCILSFVMLNVIMQRVIMPSVVRLSVVMLSVIMLNVIMPSVVMLSVVVLSVVTPLNRLLCRSFVNQVPVGQMVFDQKAGNLFDRDEYCHLGFCLWLSYFFLSGTIFTKLNFLHNLRLEANKLKYKITLGQKGLPG